MSTSTYFLFARPGFREGIARLFDFGNTLNTYNEFPTGEQADVAMLNLDYATTVDELRAAVEAMGNRR